MRLSRLPIVVLLLAITAPMAGANAQGGRPLARDPGDPRATVPPVRYESPFARYRPNAEAQLRSWREQNDTVGRIGGWRVYGREAIDAPKTEAESSNAAAAGGDAAKADRDQRTQGAR